MVIAQTSLTTGITTALLQQIITITHYYRTLQFLSKFTESLAFAKFRQMLGMLYRQGAKNGHIRKGLIRSHIRVSPFVTC